MDASQYPAVKAKLEAFIVDADEIYNNQPAYLQEGMFLKAMKDHGMEPDDTLETSIQ